MSSSIFVEKKSICLPVGTCKTLNRFTLTRSTPLRSIAMPTTKGEWDDAYATQARSDFAVYRGALTQSGVEECHRLHYLQMACEKTAKAYRLRDTDESIEEARRSHVAFSKFIEGYVRSNAVKRRYSGRTDLLRKIDRISRLFASDIERLAPAVDPTQRPQNAEYPREADGKIVTPCKYDFSDLLRLYKPDGIQFLRFIETAFSDFEEIRL